MLSSQGASDLEEELLGGHGMKEKCELGLCSIYTYNGNVLGPPPLVLIGPYCEAFGSPPGMLSLLKPVALAESRLLKNGLAT